MNKGAIKNFAINARKKLISTVESKMGELGITKNECTLPVQKGEGYEVYKTIAGTEKTIYGDEIFCRRSLVKEIKNRGYENIVEEVAYTWFNRIIAIRFMEVNNYLPTRVRVLSSDIEGKIHPDILNEAPDIDLDFTEEEVSLILNEKAENKLDELFRFLFIKQCNKLGEILPELFEKTKDYTEMLLNISYINEDDVIRMLVDGVPEEDFDITTKNENGEVQGQVEIIGWLYQYYNTELKDDTFKNKVKIPKERVPAATQLFTPDWIVKYMVENSLGRLWIEHLKAIDSTINEKEIAEKFEWKYYLEEAEQEEEVNIKLAEIRKSYKDLTPQDITCIDPCMGSGHILVYMFDVLMDIYTSEGYSEKDAVFYIINKNIRGLDIDKRAYQLAYFSIMMKGRSYNRRFFNGKKIEEEGKTRTIHPNPCLHEIEESNELPDDLIEQLSINFKEIFSKEDLECIKYVQDVFYDAKEYGSIINIDSYYNRKDRQYADVSLKLYSLWVGDNEILRDNNLNLIQKDLLNEIYPILDKLLQQAWLMSEKYEIVVTNPPYMGASSMDKKLSDYVKKNYSDSKSDLFAVFIEKCIDFLNKDGYLGMITQHSWMFLSSFENLRKEILKQRIINMAHLGARAFEEIGGEVVQTTSFVISKVDVDNYLSTYSRLVDYNSQVLKEKAFIRKKNIFTFKKENFNKIPGSPIAYWITKNIFNIFEFSRPLNNIANPKQGLATGDNNRFLRLWYECNNNNIFFNCKNGNEANDLDKKWFPYNKGGDYRKWYGNNEYIVNWKNNGEEIKNFKDEKGKLRSRPQNVQYYFKKCFSWSLVSSDVIAFRYKPEGFIFDVAGMSCFCDEYLVYLLAFCNSNVAMECLKILAPTINYQAGDIARLPIILDKTKNQKINIIVSKNICISKQDWDSFEISWDFNKHPLITYKTSDNNTDNSTNKCNYKIEDSFNLWKENAKMNFYKLKENEEELNRIFIDIYGLQDELTPEEDDKDVTVRKADRERDIKSFISYAVGCMLGRYSLDAEGLIYAGGDFKDKWDLENKKVRSIKKNEDGNIVSDTWVDAKFLPEKDNIIPITEEEYLKNDIVSRFVEFVKTVYGEDTLEENLKFIA
ncbi:MAG: BREX-1 system adenine-specific DNA-methyltransferase PglX, partial [Bacilli bacterium]|nr:BREX-1 system adenine-specific DNA-methyltransferase PglX [Bacilli bacterium]